MKKLNHSIEMYLKDDYVGSLEAEYEEDIYGLEKVITLKTLPSDKKYEADFFRVLRSNREVYWRSEKAPRSLEKGKILKIQYVGKSNMRSLFDEIGESNG